MIYIAIAIYFGVGLFCAEVLTIRIRMIQGGWLTRDEVVRVLMLVFIWPLVAFRLRQQAVWWFRAVYYRKYLKPFNLTRDQQLQDDGKPGTLTFCVCPGHEWYRVQVFGHIVDRAGFMEGLIVGGVGRLATQGGYRIERHDEHVTTVYLKGDDTAAFRFIDMVNASSLRALYTPYIKRLLRQDEEKRIAKLNGTTPSYDALRNDVGLDRPA